MKRSILLLIAFFFVSCAVDITDPAVDTGDTFIENNYYENVYSVADLNAILNALSLEYILDDNPSETNVFTNLLFPESSDTNVELVWESEDTNYIDNKGKVNRPVNHGQSVKVVAKARTAGSEVASAPSLAGEISYIESQRDFLFTVSGLVEVPIETNVDPVETNTQTNTQTNVEPVETNVEPEVEPTIYEQHYMYKAYEPYAITMDAPSGRRIADKFPDMQMYQFPNGFHRYTNSYSFEYMTNFADIPYYEYEEVKRSTGGVTYEAFMEVITWAKSNDYAIALNGEAWLHPEFWVIEFAFEPSEGLYHNGFKTPAYYYAWLNALSLYEGLEPVYYDEDGYVYTANTLQGADATGVYRDETKNGYYYKAYSFDADIQHIGHLHYSSIELHADGTRFVNHSPHKGNKHIYSDVPSKTVYDIRAFRD